MIRIEYIREFARLADELSFSRASEDMYITQPSLSRHVSILESELGVRLLERNTRNVSLTDEGWELYGDFTKILEDYNAAMEHAKLLSSATAAGSRSVRRSTGSRDTWNRPSCSFP